jgi:hypothetical protein
MGRDRCGDPSDSARTLVESEAAVPTILRDRRLVQPADVVDVFVYVVVLNLAAEYLPLVIAETFTLSLLTAVLLKLVLELVVLVKNRVKTRFKAATSFGGKLLAGLLLWAVLVGSKFVVLELVAVAFAGQVKLGGFFSVTGLILILLLARAGVRVLLAAPEAPDAERPGEG